MSYFSFHVKSVLKCSWLGTYLRKRRWNRGLVCEPWIEKRIEHFRSNASPEEKEVLKQDVLKMARKYRFSVDEYFCYHFDEKSEDERKTFISDMNRVDFCESLNLAKNLAIFDHKLKSSQVFKKYYGRDVCGVSSTKDLPQFKEFVSKHNRFIFKPLSGTCGQGIKIVELSSDMQALEKFIAENCVKSGNGFVVEELVVQTPEMAQFHPSSLNTIRIATIKFDDGVEAIAAFFRTGRAGNIVDNAGAGGVFGTIDMASGKIDAVGDEYGNNYVNHPDSGIPILGFEIPKWDEAIAMAKELATVVKGNRYAGWDLALTENGWVMIEGNSRGQFVWQMPRQKGWLNEANAILKRLGLAEMKKLSI